MSRKGLKQRDIEIQNKYFMPEIIRLLDEGRTVTIMLKGFSMRPFLEDRRDKALLKKCNSIEKNDVVLAETGNGQYVLHRVIKVYEGSVVLRGDGNIQTESCKINDIKGRVVGFYRKGRNKLESTGDIKWQLYSFIWNNLFPIRRYLLFAYRKLWLRVFPVKL